jgi:hypothetical protein
MMSRLSERREHRAGSHPVVCESVPLNYDLILQVISELADSSEITISARTRRNLFGTFEVLAEVNGGDAMQAFWDSNESVSRM